MADLLTPSKKIDDKSMKSTGKSITKEEAAALLQSALNYCSQAGLQIKGYNDEAALVLQIQGINELARKIIVVTPSFLESDTKTPAMVSPKSDQEAI